MGLGGACCCWSWLLCGLGRLVWYGASRAGLAAKQCSVVQCKQLDKLQGRKPCLCAAGGLPLSFDAAHLAAPCLQARTTALHTTFHPPCMPGGCRSQVGTMCLLWATAAAPQRRRLRPMRQWQVGDSGPGLGSPGTWVRWAGPVALKATAVLQGPSSLTQQRRPCQHSLCPEPWPTGLLHPPELHKNATKDGREGGGPCRCASCVSAVKWLQMHQSALRSPPQAAPISPLSACPPAAYVAACNVAALDAGKELQTFPEGEREGFLP